ncbi:MAG: putative sulfate exporter family transporter [Pseudomonadota bacterium]
MGSTSARLPGVGFCLALAVSAYWVERYIGGSSMAYALLLGFLVRLIAPSLQQTEGALSNGVTFTSKTVLRLGVGLLGARIALGDISALGAETVVLTIGALAFSICIGYLIARALGADRDLAIISAGAVSICGASAALAVFAIFQPTQSRFRDTMAIVIGVTAMSTLAMFAYPAIAAAANLDAMTAGVFFGATIHDVAQVVGAGYLWSETAGDTAVIVKLTRVACLAPAIALMALYFSRTGASGLAIKDTNTPIPGFLLGFIALAVANSIGLIPASLASILADLATWALLAAMAALGLKTCPIEIKAVGARPFLILALQSLFLLAFVIVALLLRA